MIQEVVQSALDYEEVRQTLYRFAEALDNRDWALLRGLCQNEVDADFSAWGIPAQRISAEAFVGSYQAAFWRPELVTQHLYSNFRIAITGDRADVVFNFLGQHYAPGFAGGEEFFLRGEYTDTLQRVGATWKIGAARLRVFYATGAAGMLAPNP